MRTLLLSLPLLGFLIAQLALGEEPKPTPKFPLGKETTVVTGPLDKEGYIDYEAALNERLGKGVTPEKNANVLLWKALGPKPEGGKGMPPGFFKTMGIDPPPEKGEYFAGFYSFMKERLKSDREKWEAISDHQSRTIQRPWSAKDYPHIAEWLKLNEKPLAVAVEASKRPNYFNPFVSRDTDNGPCGLLGAVLPAVHQSREVSYALVARAMLRMGEGKFDGAWQDLLACHRLARLIGRGATLSEALVAIAADWMASHADLVYLAHARLSTRQVQDRLKELQALPAMLPLADRIDLFERCEFLASLQHIRRGVLDIREGIFATVPSKKPGPDELEALERIDWEAALREGNLWFDRLAAALRYKERAARVKELGKIARELTTRKIEMTEMSFLVKLFVGKDKPARTVGRAISDLQVSELMPAFQQLHTALDRQEQLHRNLLVAFALAACRIDTGNYPAKLADLAAKYLQEIPGDIFSGKDLVYRLAKDGYLLYSVGANGEDDEGRRRDDDPPGDDVTIRMPLPEPKASK